MEEENVATIGVQFTSLHHIDHESGVITPIDINSKSEDLAEYTMKLITDIREKNSKRSFEFASETTEVRAAIGLMINGNYQASADINANRLLNVERKAQDNMTKLGILIQKGSLFQTVINVDSESKMIIIGKADHNDFLDASDFSVHKGMPWKKKIFKSFLATTDYEGNIKKIMVSDTTHALTKYWWSDFLELSEVRTNRFNTKKFLEIIDKKVFDPIKKSHPADHTTLRNSVIGHFRANTSFDLDHLFDEVFRNYTPKDEGLPLDSIRDKVSNIPEKYSLDSQFDIEKEEINKREVNKVILNEGMELILKGAANMKDIDTFEDEEGEKYIAIRTEEGYRRFKQ